jgi:hypothetical protein
MAILAPTRTETAEGMDWFEKVTGFRELGYEETRSRLRVTDGRLHSMHSARSYGVGFLEAPSVAELRVRARAVMGRVAGRLKVSCVSGDVRQMHADPKNESALFQVASQFNLLEMTSERVTPEHGVTRYEADRTQGPACAIAAGAATIYRNYFAPIDGGTGQTRTRQIDCLKDLGAALGNGADRALWTMENGYAMCTERGLASIDERLAGCSSDEIDDLRSRLRIGLHREVELTERAEAGHCVSQAFCSALPVGYSRLRVHAERWCRFATLVLEAAYEATLLAALLNLEQTGCGRVFLTRVGGGAFGNDGQWILSAMRRALEVVQSSELDVRIVSYGAASDDMRQLASRLSDRCP